MNLSRAFNRRMGGAGMRRGLRGGGGGGAAALTLLGYRDMTSANHVRTANPGGIAGVGTGFHVAVLATLNSLAVANVERRLFNRGGGDGWLIRTVTTNTSLQFMALNGAGAFVTAPARNLVAGDVGKVHLIHGVHDGSFLRLYVDRVEVGSGTAIAGFTPTATVTAMGARPAVYGCDGWTIHGAIGGHAVPSLAEHQALCDAVKLAYAMVPIAGKTDRVWNALANGQRFFESLAADHADKSAADLTVVSTTSPAWGW